MRRSGGAQEGLLAAELGGIALAHGLRVGRSVSGLSTFPTSRATVALQHPCRDNDQEGLYAEQIAARGIRHPRVVGSVGLDL